MAKSMFLVKVGSRPRFEVRTIDLPSVPENGVRIDVYTAGVNFADAMMMRGLYPDAPKPPSVPGYEVAGMVAEAGKGSRFKKGDRVFGISIFGGYTDEICLDDSYILKIPNGIDYETAVALPVNYATAAVALKDMCRLQKSDWLLVHGGAGGVGRMALQISRNLGAHSIATVSSDEKEQTAIEAGAEHVINYLARNFDEEVMGITKGQGVNCILDPVGGENLSVDSKCLSLGGRIVLFGLAAAVKRGRASKIRVIRAFLHTLKHSPMLLMNRNQGIFGLNLLKYLNSPRQEEILKHLEEARSLVSEGRLNVHIGGKYRLDEAKQALEDILSRKTTGKLVLLCR